MTQQKDIWPAIRQNAYVGFYLIYKYEIFQKHDSQTLVPILL